MKRPAFEDVKTGEEFNRWYWLKGEMVEICKHSNLPTHGRKFDLRDRIMYALDNNGAVKEEPREKKATSKFNWAKAELTPQTLITDNISFGPNFRKFMKSQIGNKFSCHSDFMDWVKANEGKTLKYAVEKWYVLEARKDDPKFSREIADNNMFNQYTRDFLNDNAGKTLKDAKRYWQLKKQLPTKDGFVRYERTDLAL
ncbi:DUF6434 domain-containing protein [Tunicatimonas pelagia]|uniref:DUF6434 domain-containing protein n=1 Tax=Tunicatimonas pelagia TaxID=931531 RepID=UPI002665785B|nr:DUF6434 domain-containing protein [Tunicatimonas pelagia]WKN43905.1 DUF6434 domain-containing protein [Tunicatimonas pelagia]